MPNPRTTVIDNVDGRRNRRSKGSTMPPWPWYVEGRSCAGCSAPIRGDWIATATRARTTGSGTEVGGERPVTATCYACFGSISAVCERRVWPKAIRHPVVGGLTETGHNSCPQFSNVSGVKLSLRTDHLRACIEVTH